MSQESVNSNSLNEKKCPMKETSECPMKNCPYLKALKPEDVKKCPYLQASKCPAL